MSFRIVVVEDEVPSIALLTDYIARIPDLALAATFRSALQAKAFLEADGGSDFLLVLDVGLPDFSGLEMLGMLRRQPMTIVTSAHSRFALQSYEYLVVDYLLKPISLARFVQAIDKARYLREDRDGSPRRPPTGHLMVRENGSLVRILHSEIRWVESYGEYVKIHLPGRVVMPLMALTKLEKELPPELFVRIHRQRIVTVAGIDAIMGNELVLDGERHPIGRRYRANLLQVLGRHQERETAS